MGSKLQDSEPPILKEGYLVKQGGLVKNWKRRWFVLRGPILYYYENDDKLKLKDTINLQNCQILPVETIGSREHCIQIEGEHGKRIYYLCAYNAKEQMAWINTLVRGSLWSESIQEIATGVAKDDRLVVSLKGATCPCCTGEIETILTEWPKATFVFNEESGILKLEGVFDRAKILSSLKLCGFIVYLEE